MERFKGSFGDYNPNWFLPVHLGGLGFSPFLFPFRVTREQRKVAHVLTTDPKCCSFFLGKGRQPKTWGIPSSFGTALSQDHNPWDFGCEDSFSNTVRQWAWFAKITPNSNLGYFYRDVRKRFKKLKHKLPSIDTLLECIFCVPVSTGHAVPLKGGVQIKILPGSHLSVLDSRAYSRLEKVIGKCEDFWEDMQERYEILDKIHVLKVKLNNLQTMGSILETRIASC
jgi:hypothetical protein